MKEIKKYILCVLLVLLVTNGYAEQKNKTFEISKSLSILIPL